MRQKKLKQLRKLSEFDCHAPAVYKGKAHGIRTRANTANVKVNGKMVQIPIEHKYQAITIVNESKMKYNLAKKIFHELSKTYYSKGKK